MRNGDPIALDVDARTVELEARRGRGRTAARRPPAPPVPRYARGYGRLYIEHVMQADGGCDFDFLRARPGEAAESEPLGLVGGSIGGW